MSDFATRLINWQRLHGRNTLPWQVADAYRVWLSEIMLQQTQVATVIPYYQRFVTSFPDVTMLAAASEEQVLAHWSGLGYYARGRNLHRAAQQIMLLHDGQFPSNFDDVLALPGIGRSTAAAICALAFKQQHAILDGNVKRVLARYCAIEGYTGDKKIEAQLWQQAEELLPECDVASYTQGMMDLGATVCTRSKAQCNACPVQSDCAAFQTGRVAELPAPRPRKAVPERHATFLLLQHNNEILLGKNFWAGIWAGLWCLPRFDDEAAALAWCAQADMEITFPSRYSRHLHEGASLNPVQPENESMALRPFTHTFTHFKLHITPLLAQAAKKPRQMQEPGSMWLDVEEALQAAIPTPVRTLLQKLQAQRTLT